jgi:hypothetical protein
MPNLEFPHKRRARPALTSVPEVAIFGLVDPVRGSPFLISRSSVFQEVL